MGMVTKFDDVGSVQKSCTDYLLCSNSASFDKVRKEEELVSDLTWFIGLRTVRVEKKQSLTKIYEFWRFSGTSVSGLLSCLTRRLEKACHSN